VSFTQSGFDDVQVANDNPANFTVLPAAIVISLGSGVRTTPVKRREMYAKVDES
jgi:hypothetical protein